MLNAEDVARGWGFTEPKNGKEYVRWRTINGYLNEFGFSQDVAKDDFIPENMVYRLGFKASNETAQVFQAKLADEILPQIRKTGSYQIAKMATEQEKANIQMDKARASLANARAKQAKLLLEIADRAQVEMYRSIIIAKATNLLAEENLLPMPRSEQQRSRHGLAYFCRMVGKPETWASQMGKELLKAGIEKKPGENGEYIETTAKGGGKQVQGFEWYDDYLAPIAMRMFTHTPENEM
jgi:prophage antirepressor-like protein